MSFNFVERESKSLQFDGEEALSLLETLLAQAISVETQIETAQLDRKILEALFRLPPRQRAVIVQRYYLEMSESEMAQTLEIAPGTVKWLLNAARTRLRSMLGVERSAE